MSEQEARTCLGCDGELRPITIMDMGHRGYVGALMYRSANDKPSFWTGRYPTAGPVQAYLCQDCGRIAMFGQPTPAEESEGPADG
jgi:hypothetical protein